MRVLWLALAFSAALVAAPFVKERLSPSSSVSVASDVELAQEGWVNPNTPDANLEAARKFGWEAAVMVQKPPHSIDIWQEAKVKWRKAIRLLEAIPEGTPVSAEAKKKLVFYRMNYNAIRQRLAAEQAAQNDLSAAQTLAWQAAVTVQDPPHPLRVWQRAFQKWEAAIDLLEPIPPTTSAGAQSQEKLQSYRNNYTEIHQRLTTESEAIQALERFLEATERLNDVPTKALTGSTGEQIGISFEEYDRLVKQLESDLARFTRHSTAKMHPVYTDLVEAMTDYRFARDLWQLYRDLKQRNQEDFYDDLFNQLIPIARLKDASVIGKYGLKTFSNDKKISLRLSVWNVWDKAAERIGNAHEKMANLN